MLCIEWVAKRATEMFTKLQKLAKTPNSHGKISTFKLTMSLLYLLIHFGMIETPPTSTSNISTEERPIRQEETKLV